MSFRENLIHLRATRNMTQEQLAMLVGVSRQSVTKWESERSYPEMDKLLKICQVFDCTLDDLVQGDLTDRAPDPTASQAPVAPPADVFGYDEHMRRFASRISGGVMAIILGVALATWLFGLGEPHGVEPAALSENMAGALGLLCIFAAIAAGLGMILPAGMAHSAFVRAHPYIEDFYTEDQRALARSSFTAQLIGGILIIALGVCLILMFADTPYEESLGVPLMLICIAVGVRFIINGSMQLSRTNLDNYNLAAGEVLSAQELARAPIPDDRRQGMLVQGRQEKRIGAVCGTIMIVATIVALLMLFIPQLSGPTGEPLPYFWLPWPIGGLLCGIASLLMKGFGSDD